MFRILQKREASEKDAVDLLDDSGMSVVVAMDGRGRLLMKLMIDGGVVVE
jgi:hypothetical protein